MMATEQTAASNKESTEDPHCQKGETKVWHRRFSLKTLYLDQEACEQ